MFYTSVNRQDNKIYVRGYTDDGLPFKEEVSYRPYLFVRSSTDKGYKTVLDENVEKMNFSTIRDANNFIKKYSDLPTYKIYGMREHEFVYIYDKFPADFHYSYDHIRIVDIDIENDSEGGFANILEADREITAITLSKRGKETIVLGMKPWDDPDYIQCANEKELLETFLNIWNSKEWRPDIVSGWNIKMYDIPYLVNRIRRVLGEKYSDRMSPWKIVKAIEVEQRNGKKINTYNLFGIQIIDLYEAYKKFAMGERESYTLDFIANYELEETKVDYKGLGYLSLDDLYKRNPALYYTYNKQDTVLISKLEAKLHYIEQIVTVAYLARVNFENVIRTVKTWDVLIHNYLLDQNIVVNPMDMDREDENQIIGGYVKEPVPGYYPWVSSLDFSALYPSIVILCNISPDTFVNQLDRQPPLDTIIYGDPSNITDHLIKRDYAMTANGCLFRRDKQGFLPAIMQSFLIQRKAVKKEMIALEKQKEALLKEGSKDTKDLETQIRHRDNLQNALKLLNNSGYGAVANKYFRWFMNPLAEGVTSTGQMVSQYVAAKINVYLNEMFDQERDWIIYQDTDSAYINLKSLIDKINIQDREKALKACVRFMEEKLSPQVDKVFCQDFAKIINAYDPSALSMKFETACDQAFFVRKKRYVLDIMYKEGVFLSKPKIKVTGLESQRSSVPKVAREKMLECFKIIFDGDRKKLVETINLFKKEFFKMPFMKIGKPSSVQGLDKYFDTNNLYIKSTPIHVRGSLIYNTFLERNGLDKKYEYIYNHDKIRYCYLVKENPTKENVIAVKNDPPPELELEKYVDYETQWEKIFFEPMRHICDAIGWDVEEVSTLDDIF